MRAAFTAVFSLFLLGCGAPDAPTTPTAARTFTLNGVVRDASSNAPLAAATVDIVSGANAGRSAAGGVAGDFSFAGIEAGSVVLRASVDGYVAAERAIEIAANTVIDLTLTPAPKAPVPPPVESPPATQARTVSGQVTDTPVGGGVASARVEVLSGVNRGKFVETDGNGFFQLTDVAADQQVQVRAYKIGYTLVDREVSIGRGNVSHVDFTLERRRLTLTGALAFSGGVTTVGARVELIDGPDRGRVSNTDAANRYLLDRITWGSHRIRVTSECLDAVETTLVIPGDSPWLGDTLTHNVSAALRTGTLKGSVSEQPRQVLSAGASVTLQTREGRRIDSQTTGASGMYSFSGLCGNFYLIVEKKDFVPWSEPASVFRDTTKDIVIPEQRFQLTLQDVRYSAPGAKAEISTGFYSGLSCTTWQNGDRDDPPHCFLEFRGPATIRLTKPGHLPQDVSIDLQGSRSLQFSLTKMP